MFRYFTMFAIVGVLLLAGCRAEPIYNPTNVPYPASATRALTVDDYRDAIIRAGARRGWTFQDEGPGHLVGTVAVRGKHFATVDITFDTETYSIAYKDSQNLNHDASRSEIHPNYNSWVKNLQADIQTEIGLLRSGA